VTIEQGRPKLSRARIVGAALQIIDDEGMERLSVRRLAQDLEAAPMALYSHFRSKDELMAAVVDQVFGEVEITSSEHWEDDLRKLACSFRQALVRHPGVVPLITACAAVSTNAARATEAAHAFIRRSGLPDPYVARAARAVYAYTLGAVTLDVARTSALGPDKRHVFLSLPVDEFPTMSELAPHLVNCPPDEHFEFGLDMLIRSFQAATPAAH